MAAGSPSSDSTREALREDLMFKMYLAHELAMGEDDAGPPLSSADPLYDTVKRHMHDAFWNIFSEELSRQPPDYKMVVPLIEEIRESLFSVMTPNSASVRAEVEETLDIELMKQQLEHGALDVDKYGAFIVSAMSRICAPVRDDDLVPLKGETDPVKLFRGILEVLDLMKLDLVKFALSSIKPEILNNKMEYERNKFNDLVRMESGQLPNTELWLRRHTRDNADDPAELVVFRALSDLLNWRADDPYPETLFVDAARLLALKRDFYKLVVAASAVLLTYTRCPPEVVGDVAFKATLKSHALVLLNGLHDDASLATALPNLSDQFTVDVNAQLEGKQLPPLADDQAAALAEQIAQTANPDNGVRSLVAKRILDYLLASAVSPQQPPFPPALLLFQQEIDNLNSRFKFIANFNVNICRDYYAVTIAKLRAE